MVKVQVRGGQEFEFDEVVVTAPLGWLKRNKLAFQPPLPGKLSEAIDSISYGCLEKVRAEIPRDSRAGRLMFIRFTYRFRGPFGWYLTPRVGESRVFASGCHRPTPPIRIPRSGTKR
jgi:hypothetical protein